LGWDKFPEKQMAVVYYYPGLDNCNKNREPWKSNVFLSKGYDRKLRKIARYQHFCVYKSDENLEKYRPDKHNWQEDHNQTMENVFFKNHYPCNSVVVLDNKGNYLAIFGESGDSQILEVAQKLMEKE